MWRYVFLLLRRQPGKSVLASGGFLLATCGLILLSATTQTTVVQGNQVISQNWRPTYDLVVLPPQTKIPPGQIVPADYLQSYDGGISTQQYAQIASLPGVEVAAPIAYIGYIALPSPQISFPTQNFAPGYYQLSWTLTAFNGQRHLVEYQQSDIYQIFPCATIYDVRSLSIVLQEQSRDTCSFPLPGFRPVLSFATPETGVFLLAAIDPTAENHLVHLNTSMTSGRMLTAQDTIHQDQRISGTFLNHQGKPFPVEAIPMLIHQQLPGQITLSASLTQLAQSILSPQELRKLGGAAYLTHLPHHTPIFNGIVPMVQNNPQRFANTRLAWNGRSWETLPPSTQATTDNSVFYFLDFSSASTPAGLTYQPATAPNGGPAYALVPTGTQGPEAAFRNLKPLHTLKKQFQDVAYTFEDVGQFADARIAAQFSNPLNWLPENTYTVPPVVLRYDAQGHPVQPTVLIPTTNRAGFVTQPPLALTTLAAAQQLTGNSIISAIRVRVAGVNQANQDSWQRIQQVAGLIHQRTHLPVVVTLGSSPRPTLVYVPGVNQGQFGARQTIAPVGWVEERWIDIGASILYLAQLGAIRFLLLGAVLAVCLGYVVVAFSALATAQRKDFAILSALGWPPWQPARLFLVQALLFAIVGGLTGLSIALLLITLLRAIPLWPVVVWALPTMMAMALVSSLYPLWNLWHIHPAEILRAGSAVTSRRAVLLNVPFWSKVSPMGMLAVRNLTRSHPRTLVAIGSLFFSAVLLVLMASSILALHQSLQGTLLGNVVLVQTAVPQIAGSIIAVLLTFLSVADLLLLQVRERRQEIGLLQAVGWRPVLLRRMFVQEGLTLTLIGTVPGVLAALMILATQHSTQSTLPVGLEALGVVLLLAAVSALATLPALRAMSRVQVTDVLRAE